MNEWAGAFAEGLVKPDEELDAAFEVHLRDSSPLVFRVAYGVLRHRQDAEDVAQEAFARAYRKLGQLRDRDRFRAWLVRMTWRLAIDRWRAERRRAGREEAVLILPAPRTTDEDAEANERALLLWRAIDGLPEKLRVVVVLAAIEEHDTREVARLLEVPEGTVKSRLFTARKRLAEVLRCLRKDPAAR
jgi:RNA polymerase sigma-70 factor (ECF subfamily)